MMFVDASAFVAIIAEEPDAEFYSAALSKTDSRPAVTSAIAIYEATRGVARLLACGPTRAQQLVLALVGALEMNVLPITQQHSSLALAAFDRFGKGNHPAALNMGDCFAYAVASDLQIPILFKGNDFSKTDLQFALATL
jgi:ribonuclease VapC